MNVEINLMLDEVINKAIAGRWEIKDISTFMYHKYLISKWPYYIEVNENHMVISWLFSQKSFDFYNSELIFNKVRKYYMSRKTEKIQVRNNKKLTWLKKMANKIKE